MLYTKPDYFDQFICTADKCEDTCCAGWKIVIDKETYRKYKKYNGDFKTDLRKGINTLSKTFKQDREKRCAFLNEKNLCDLYLAMGEDGFCNTCKNYPRHIEEFEGVREISLSVSCPEVAKILMERKSPVTFVSYEKEGDEEFDNFDPFLFSVLEDARSMMINILQNRSLTLRTRISLILELAYDIEEKINNKDMFSCSEVIERYGKRSDFVDSEAAESESAECAETYFKKLYKLELLKEDWLIQLKQTDFLLYNNGIDHYKNIRNEFNCWATKNTDLDIHLEQLLVYFIFTYFPGAVYDGEIYSKVTMSVYLVWMLREIWMSKWLEHNKELHLIEMTELLYRFSREVEHSDKNLKQVEKMAFI